MNETLASLEEEKARIGNDPDKYQLFAVVMMQSIDMRPITGDSFVNMMRPFSIVESEENTRKLLNTQYPNSLVVIAPKFFFLQGGFDLFFDDFNEPVVPTGKAPVQFKYAEELDELIWSKFHAGIPLKDIEQEVLSKYSDSEVAKLIAALYREVKDYGLTQFSSTKFDHRNIGEVEPLNVLVTVKYEPGTCSLEAIANSFLMTLHPNEEDLVFSTEQE